MFFLATGTLFLRGGGWSYRVARWDLSSPTSNWTAPPILEVQSLNHWITREVPQVLFGKPIFCASLRVFVRISYSSLNVLLLPTPLEPCTLLSHTSQVLSLSCTSQVLSLATLFSSFRLQFWTSSPPGSLSWCLNTRRSRCPHAPPSCYQNSYFTSVEITCVLVPVLSTSVKRLLAGTQSCSLLYF